jgi:uncharacterized membrane protein YjjB (DUF3815 family)
MIYLLEQFIFALLATCGFCIIFRIPPRKIPICMIIGAVAWVFNQIAVFYGASEAIACFLASCTVGLLSDIASRVFKEASTIFTIPGILCLVPGAKIYDTMYALLNGQLEEAASVGTQTLLMAGAIATGLLIIGAVISVIRSIIAKTVALKDKL